MKKRREGEEEKMMKKDNKELVEEAEDAGRTLRAGEFATRRERERKRRRWRE